MNRSLAFSFAALCLAATSVLGQSFDCQVVGPFPAIGGAGDCEGVTSNNLGAGTGVTNAAHCGIPTSGAQFARITANGPILGAGVGQPAGAPIARPVAAIVTEVRVPVPAGATSVGLCYNFFRGEGANQTTYNDGLEIAIVDASGATVLVALAHIDTFSVMAPGVCGPTYPEAGIDGPESAYASFPGGLAAGAYLSIACWNSGDNAVASYSVVDSILWNVGAAVCPYTPPTPPGNDNCATPITVTVGTNPAPAASGNTFTNDAATNPVGYPAVCGSLNKDVWFQFTPSINGIYQIDNETPAGFTTGTNTNTTLAVYPTGCVAGPALACDADTGVTGGGLMPLLLMNMNGGTTYDIRVGSVSTTLTGTFYLNIAFVGPAGPNDECSGAIALVVGTNPAPASSGNTFNNVAMTTSLGYPAACATIVNDVWFSFTPSISDTYVFDTNTPCGFAAGTMTNTTMALYGPTSCTTPAAAIACDADSGAGSLSLLQAALTAGSTYYLRVGPTTAVFQTFYVNVRQGALATNNECTSPITVGLGTNPAPGASCNYFTNDLATNSAGWLALTGCASPAINNDVWFAFTAPASGPYIIDTSTPCGFTAGTATNTTMAIYDATCTPSIPAIACDADSGTGTLSSVNPTLVAGLTYMIRVGTTAATGAGTFYLNINPGTSAPTNDTCATPIAVGIGINPAPAASCYTFANDFATTDVGYPAVCGTIVNDVWFVFTPPASGDYRFDTETPAGFTVGTNTNSTVAVYGSCLVGPPLACDADSGVTGTGLMSIVTSNGLTAGVPVYVRVGSTSATLAGTFYLSINRIFSVTFSSPFGPGSLQFDIVAGPVNGTYYLPITFNAGAFPSGWLYGVDIFLQDILNELATGYPFVGPLNAQGDSSFGPIGGVPSGLTFYAVGLGFPGAVVDYPTANTAPKTYTVP